MKYYTRDEGRRVGRSRVGDVAFQFRMGAGFPGDVNRTHPVSISPYKIDATNPPTLFGQAVVFNTAANSVRAVLDTDDAITEIAGVVYRPYPTQDPGLSAAFGVSGLGTGTPATNQPVDVVTLGFVMVTVVGTPTLGGAVFLWTAPSAGSHVVGGFEASATGGSTAALDTSKYRFNGPPDANGNVELVINL